MGEVSSPDSCLAVAKTSGGYAELINIIPNYQFAGGGNIPD
jgi:hypothetical protein